MHQVRTIRYVYVKDAFRCVRCVYRSCLLVRLETNNTKRNKLLPSESTIIVFKTVCQSCHLLDVANRCPELPDAVPALKEGDLNQIFERIVETAPGNRTTLTAKERRELVKLEMTEYTVTVHSRPNAVTNANANSISRDKKLDPWVIALDNFLTDEECDALIQHGYDAGYKRSEDVGALKFDGTYGSVQSTGRTSENAWCGVANECRGKTVPKRILNRMSSIMGIPTGNSEDFQILKYEVGQCR